MELLLLADGSEAPSKLGEDVQLFMPINVLLGPLGL